MRAKKPKNDIIQEIVLELMEEFNLGKTQIEVIINSPYKFIFNKMREEKFYNFNLPGIGKVYVSPGRKAWLKDNYPKIKAKRLKRQLEREEFFRLRRLKRDEQIKADSGGMEQPGS